MLVQVFEMCTTYTIYVFVSLRSFAICIVNEMEERNMSVFFFFCKQDVVFMFKKDWILR